jgi:hypothetical protein
LGVIFEAPVLVVGTPSLWVFDAANAGGACALAPSQHLTLKRLFQVADLVPDRLVDIVAESGVPAFIDACRSTIDDLEGRVRRHATTLAELADRQRSALDNADLEKAADAYAGIFRS